MEHSEYLPDNRYSPQLLMNVGSLAVVLTYFNSRVQAYFEPRRILTHVVLLGEEGPRRFFDRPHEVSAMVALRWPFSLDWYPEDAVFRDYEYFQAARLDWELGQE